MPLDRATFVNPPLGGHVCAVRFFRRFVQPYVQRAIPVCDFGAPPAIRVPSNPQHAAAFIVRARSALILGVNAWRRHAQVFYPVVFSVAVNVVKHAVRPFAVNVKPSKAMRGITSVVTPNQYVAVVFPAVDRTCWPFMTAESTREQSGIWIVLKDLAQTMRGNIALSHEAVISLIGQRLGSVSALAGLRYYRG